MRWVGAGGGWVGDRKAGWDQTQVRCSSMKHLPAPAVQLRVGKTDIST